eukprot:3029975-Prymnesium_polylepis.1
MESADRRIKLSLDTLELLTRNNNGAGGVFGVFGDCGVLGDLGDFGKAPLMRERRDASLQAAPTVTRRISLAHSAGREL